MSVISHYEKTSDIVVSKTEGCSVEYTAVVVIRTLKKFVIS